MKWPTIARILSAVLLLSGAIAGQALAAESYTFAVTPQFEQRKLYAIWNPIVQELQKRTGVQLKLVAALSVPEFEKGISAGSFDFVYANPYHIYHEIRGQGYIPLVRDNVPLRGIIVVRKDNPVRDISELNGKVLAMPSPNALGAGLLPRAELERLRHVKMTYLYVKTHSSVYLHVANGLADAGGGVEKTLAEQDKAIRDQLRILYTTQGFPSLPVAAHPRIPKDTREKIRQALLDIGNTPEGRKMLAEVPITQVVPASTAEYEALRKLNLESYWVEEKK